MKYLVTTNILDLAPYTSGPIYMVDGTVPGFQGDNDTDLHFDHHRTGGAAIQVDEMVGLVPGDLADGLIVTTLLDADAAVAAAYLQCHSKLSEDSLQRLRAIAHDCDHLGVGDEHQHLAEFAAKAVAALKQTGFEIANQMELSKDRRQWSDGQRLAYYSAAFRQATEWLIDAALGERDWPGQNGEADEYWVNLQTQIDSLGGLLTFVQDSPYDLNGEYKYRSFTVPVFNLTEVHEYVDPGVMIQLIKNSGETTSEVTLTARSHKSGKGISYTLGSVPKHPMLSQLDFCAQGVFDALTKLEKLHNPDCDPWGGRATVGGSGWNTPSSLEPQQVVDIVADMLLNPAPPVALMP